MDKREARAFLSLLRAGEPLIDDARFEEAQRLAHADPELRDWWEKEQALDRAIAGKLAAVDAPADLKGRLHSTASKIASSCSEGTMFPSSASRSTAAS